jgi:hypothetical protein
MASMNVYLTKTAQIEKTRLGETFQGFKIKDESGRWLAYQFNFDQPLPESLLPFVEEITVHDIIPSSPSRVRGIYQHAHATAVVDRSSGKSDVFSIRASGHSQQNLVELLRLIRLGTILPIESYENAQIGGKTFAQAEAELAVATEEVEYLRARVRELTIEKEKLLPKPPQPTA